MQTKKKLAKTYYGPKQISLRKKTSTKIFLEDPQHATSIQSAKNMKKITIPKKRINSMHNNQCKPPPRLKNELETSITILSHISNIYNTLDH
jgi:hypothetical protein